MIPLKDLIPELHHDSIEPPTRIVITREPSDVQETVDRITRERREEQRAHDTLMHTLIYSVWRRR